MECDSSVPSPRRLTHAATRIGAERLRVWRTNLLRFTSTVEHVRQYCQFGRGPCSCVSIVRVPDVALCQEGVRCNSGEDVPLVYDGQVGDQQILDKRLLESHVLLRPLHFGRSEFTRRRMTGNIVWLTMSLCMLFVFLSSRDSITGVAPMCSPALLPAYAVALALRTAEKHVGTHRPLA